VKLPEGIVFGRVLPALGIALPIGNLYYAYLAYRLAKAEGRSDVTAMPYGPSVPHMFIVVFVIMLPVYLKTQNALLAWQAGLAWAFIIGIIVLIGAFIGPTIRRLTPRAAMLGTLAGISIAFISLRPAFQMWEVPWISFISLGIVLIAWTANVRLPGGIPGGLAAVIVGTVIAWVAVALGWSDIVTGAQVSASLSKFGIHLPLPSGDVIAGLTNIAPLLVTAIPLGIYNFTEGMNNVESASAAGDNYNLRSILLADGIGAVVGSILGSPFPPAVYIGHPGWKAVGGRIGYSLATGVVIALVCFLGLTALLLAVVPLVAILPILLYIGLVIGCAGLPGGAGETRAGGGAGDHSEHRGVGPDPDRRRAQRRWHQRVPARDGQARSNRRGLSRHGTPGRRCGARGPDAGCDRRFHYRPRVHEGRGLLAGSGRAVVLRLHPWCAACMDGLADGGGGLRRAGSYLPECSDERTDSESRSQDRISARLKRRPGAGGIAIQQAENAGCT
jgi:xanthine/uracil/vitamin C permease (AzgA family)